VPCKYRALQGHYAIFPILLTGSFVIHAEICLVEVPTSVAALDDAAHDGRHIADNKCLARGKDLETQIKPFYTFGRQKELKGGAVVEERYYAMIKRLSANQGGGDGANVVFREASVRMFRIGHKTRLQPNCTNIKARSEFLLPQCQSTHESSRDGVRLSTQGRTLQLPKIL